MVGGFLVVVVVRFDVSRNVMRVDRVLVIMMGLEVEC